MSARAISRILLSAAVIAPDTDLKCCKRSELPLYVQDKCAEDAAPVQKHHQGKPGVIEDTIRTIRINIDSVFNEVRKYEDMTKSYVKEGVDNAQWLVDYLGDEENPAPKAPAIAIGGLTGFIFGLRGGFFKKLIYTSVGALGMAAVCYPKEAKEYGGVAFDEGSKYATIAYNFAYGVKKGDKPLELPSLPKLPGSISEAVLLVTDFASSTSASLTDKAQKVKVESKEPKAVGLDDPCKWVEFQKDSGDYTRIVQAEKLRERVESGEDLSPEEAKQKGLEYYEGDESCPCHHGSCMHARSSKDCPEELPYPPRKCPDPQCPPPVPDCGCGPCCPAKAAEKSRQHH